MMNPLALTCEHPEGALIRETLDYSTRLADESMLNPDRRLVRGD